MSAQDDIVALEQRRCAAIGSGDADALSLMLSADYVHVHGTGRISDAEDFVRGILANPRITERQNLTVRTFGDFAVVVGAQTNRAVRKGEPDKVTVATVTQVLRKIEGQWQFVSFQLTPHR